MRSSSRTTRRPVSSIPAQHSCLLMRLPFRLAARLRPCDRHRRPGAQSTFAATAFAHRQPLFLVEPVKLLVVELDPLAFQYQPQPSIAEPPAREASSRSLVRSPSSPVPWMHSEVFGAGRQAHRHPAASIPSLGSPRSQHDCASWASEVFSEHLLQRRCIQHRLRQQLLQPAVLLLKRFQPRASEISIPP